MHKKPSNQQGEDGLILSASKKNSGYKKEQTSLFYAFLRQLKQNIFIQLFFIGGLILNILTFVALPSFQHLLSDFGVTKPFQVFIAVIPSILWGAILSIVYYFISIIRNVTSILKYKHQSNAFRNGVLTMLVLQIIFTRLSWLWIFLSNPSQESILLFSWDLLRFLSTLGCAGLIFQWIHNWRHQKKTPL